MRAVTALVAGVLFALGLAIGDMTSPGRVVGFLALEDATLAFVMAGAIGAFAPFAYLIKRRRAPLLASRFHWPAPAAIDPALLAGAVLFGVGWGLSGLCPGPVLVAGGTGRIDTLVFVAMMIAGTAATRMIRR